MKRKNYPFARHREWRISPGKGFRRHFGWKIQACTFIRIRLI